MNLPHLRNLQQCKTLGFYLQLQEILAFLALLFAIICLSVTLNSAKWSKKKCRRPPEPAGAWPFIGHLHLLGSNQLLHQTLGAMADKYGPAFSIHLGIHQALVISSWQVAKECFTTNDKVFPSHPRSLAVKLMGYDHAMFGFAPFGPYWHDIRKLVAVELLSNHKLELLKHVCDREINFFIKELYEKSAKNGGFVVVEMKEKLGNLAVNIIVGLMSGKQYFGTAKKALANFFYFV